MISSFVSVFSTFSSSVNGFLNLFDANLNLLFRFVVGFKVVVIESICSTFSSSFTLFRLGTFLSLSLSVDTSSGMAVVLKSS